MINLTKYKKYVLIKKEGETLMENKRFENNGGGDSPSQRSHRTRLTGSLKNVSGHEIIKGFDGTGLVKLLRYYDTKALRSNSRISKSDLQVTKRIDTTSETNYNSNMMNYNLEMLKRVQHDSSGSEAHRKHLFTYSLINLFTSKKVAFTLAEVLITLAIIGIVAAMTIPTLVAKYQEKVMVTKVKQAHSQLMNAIQLYVAKNNCQNMLCLFDTNKTSDEVIAELATVVRKAKVCKEGDTEKACKYYSLKDNKPSYKVDGVYASGDGITTNGRMYLPNGMIFQVRQGSQCPRTLETIIRDENGYEIDRVETVSHTCAFVYFDVNNTQGPNQFGADVYRYDVKDTGEIVPSKLLNNALLYNKIEYTPYNIGDPVE